LVSKKYYTLIFYESLLTYLISLFLGYLAKNSSFYASLRAEPVLQNQESMPSDDFFNNETTEWRFVFSLEK